MTKIGLLYFRKDPVATMPRLRMRALLAEAALQDFDLVLLNPQDCKPEEKTILTKRFTGGEWKQQEEALPDVVYIVGAPLLPAHAVVNTLVRENCRIIADKGVNKLKLATILAGSPAEAYLPPTEKIPDEAPAEMLCDFLRANGGAVVKRANGNQGVGLFFVTKEPGTENWQVKSDSKVFLGTLEEAANYVAKRIAGRMRYRAYLAQRHICSVAGDGRPADVRVHVQRHADGAWGITRAYVRLAEMGMPLANISKGGYQGPLEGFLNQRKVRPAAEIEAELLEAAVCIAEVEDSYRPRPLSELGIDFLIDEKDQIWLIETNTFPQSFLHEHDRAMHFLSYCKWLAEQERQLDRVIQPMAANAQESQELA